MLTRFPHAAPVALFLQDESGAVAADYIFMTAAVTAAGFAVLTTLSDGIDGLSNDIASELETSEIIFMSQNFGRDRAAVLGDGPHEFFSEDGVLLRYDIWSDPDQKTDAQLRNTHRTWSRRVNDPAYSQPGRAADLVRILEMAMDARSVDPHTNI